MAEKAAVKKVPSDVVSESHPDTRIYEVIVRFHREGKEVVETFLRSNMVSVTISETGDPEMLLAYCHFQDGIENLDSKLAALRQSAMVVLGDRDEKLFDFFVALRQLSKPLPQLLSSSRPRTVLNFVKPEWVTGLLIAFGLFIVWQGYHFLSDFVSRQVNSPPPSSAASISTVSQWAPYVLPDYHQPWLEVKKKHGLSDEMMVSLFRMIKQIDKYGPGHQLGDLTIYPQAIDRALGLIILKGIGNVEMLRTLYKTLEGYQAHWKFLPDNPIEKGSLSLSGASALWDDQIILTFYEQLLKEPRRKSTEELIQKLRRTHLSS